MANVSTATPKPQAEIVRRMWSYFQSDSTGFFSTGSRTLCRDLEDEKYTYLGWNDAVEPSVVPSVELLHVAPSLAQLRKGLLPRFAFELPSLHHLLIDLGFLNRITTPFRSPIRSLTISRNWDHPELNTITAPNPLGPFSKLVALRLIANHEKEPLTAQITESRLPQLRYLGFSVTNPIELEVLRVFPKLTDLDLTHVPLDVWDSIAALPLISLSLSGMNRSFTIEGLANLTKVKYLWINGCRAEIDCSIFRSLPNLIELDILNSKAIRNVDELLACPTLQRLRIFDCGGPLRKNRDAFHQRGFEHLDISYA